MQTGFDLTRGETGIGNHHRWKLPRRQHLSFALMAKLENERLAFGSYTYAHTGLADIPLDEAHRLGSPLLLEHKIRRAMIRPERKPLQGRIKVEVTFIGAARSEQPGRGVAAKSIAASAIEAKLGICRRRSLGQLRLKAIVDASAASLEQILAAGTTQPLVVATDGWTGYRRLTRRGYEHQAINLSKAGVIPTYACRPTT